MKKAGVIWFMVLCLGFLGSAGVIPAKAADSSVQITSLETKFGPSPILVTIAFSGTPTGKMKAEFRVSKDRVSGRGAPKGEGWNGPYEKAVSVEGNKATFSFNPKPGQGAIQVTLVQEGGGRSNTKSARFDCN
jgi:hypothetical protein